MDGPRIVRPVKVRKMKVRKVKPMPAVKPIAKPKPVVRPVARPKPVKRTRTPKRAPEGGIDGLFHLDPWKLDSSRMFHYANALRWFYTLGPKQLGIRPDLSVEVHTHDGRVEVIPAIVMVTRDARYAFGFVSQS